MKRVWDTQRNDRIFEQSKPYSHLLDQKRLFGRFGRPSGRVS